MKTKLIVIVFLLSLSFGAQPSPAFTLQQNTVQQLILPADKFRRTELYFGMNKPDGSAVSEEDLSKFLNDEVTPRFPDGFTVIESYGQYKDKSGQIVKEKSRVLILLYPKKSLKDNDPKIEEIRAAYKKTFKQESVLRLDFSQTVRISF